jgi:ketosteroid isomerase-like protein
MSRENLEVARLLVEAFNRADFDALRALSEPSVEWRDQRDWPGSEVHVGVDAMVRHFEAVMESLDGYRVEMQSVTEAPDGRLVGQGVIRAMGRGSGVPVERPAAWVLTMRAGKLARGEVFGSREDAVEAARLRD